MQPANIFGSEGGDEQGRRHQQGKRPRLLQRGHA
jgi:hypothetical protein